jgi:two-component system CitB family sensor kinase
VTLLAGGTTLHLSVQDSGPGVPAELRDSVFDEGVTTKLTPGHGLGLALARHEARGRGGDLWLVNGSDAGGGDTAADPEHGTEAGALFVAALPGVLSATTVTAPVGGDR